MKHHFGDFLPRAGGYWTIIPNRERYAHRVGEHPPGCAEARIVTIGKADEHWARVFTFPNLEELTLHEATHEQLAAIGKLGTIKRLRLTHARLRSIDFLSTMQGVEELVLEYVSGFDNLAPLRSLPRLRALHMENLRGVADFGGLAGCSGLKYLAIYGTTDWKQPVNDFEFLRGLPGLEVLQFWEFITKAEYPAMLPALSLPRLKELGLHGSYLATEEYALLEEGLPGVRGASWGPFRTTTYSYVDLPADDRRAQLPEELVRAQHPEVLVHHSGRRLVADPASQWFEGTGKGAGRIKCTSVNAGAKCRKYADHYAAMKQRARELIGR